MSKIMESIHSNLTEMSESDIDMTEEQFRELQRQIEALAPYVLKQHMKTVRNKKIKANRRAANKAARKSRKINRSK